MDLRDKIVELEAFINSEIDIFMKMLQNADREVYIKDQILRRAIDKSLNDIILATVDIAANFLKLKNDPRKPTIWCIRGHCRKLSCKILVHFELIHGGS